MIGIDAISTGIDVRASAAPSRRDGAVSSFSSLLQQAGETGTADERLHAAAEGLVSTAFIQPVLSMLREQNQAAGPFAPSAAERRFGPLLDEMIADRVTSSANFPLVDAIVNRYRASMSTSAQGDRHDHANDQPRIA
ncbi:MAG: hypothetical protein AAF432_05510 [Planctomycetota bacterium]